VTKHTFAASHGASRILDPAWQEALAGTWLKSVEYSAGQCPEPEALRAQVDQLVRMREKGIVDVASVHLPFRDDWSPSPLDPSLRRASSDRFRAFMEACRPLGARHFTFHGSREPNAEADRPALRAALRATLLELAPVARDLGASLNVEILPRTCLGRTAEEMAEIVDGMPPEIGVCFDVNHLCGNPEGVAPGIRLLAPRVCALHVSDYDGVDECHWHPGFGVIDWAAVMEAVDALPRPPLLILEITALAPPDWQNRKGTFGPVFRAFERDCFFLDHAAEWQRRIAAYRP